MAMYQTTQYIIIKKLDQSVPLYLLIFMKPDYDFATQVQVKDKSKMDQIMRLAKRINIQ